MLKKETKPKISKENFIEFLAHSTPEEIDKYISEKGKPRKLVEPIIFFEETTFASSKYVLETPFRASSLYFFTPIRDV